MSNNPIVDNLDDWQILVNGTHIKKAYIDALFYAEVDQTVYVPSMFTLRFYDEDLTILSDKGFAQLGIDIEIKAQNRQKNVPITLINGYIAAIESDFDEEGNVLLTLRGYDHLHKMTFGNKTRSFINSKDQDAASKIATEAGLTLNAVSTTGVYKYLIQDNQSDLSMLQLIARRNNLYMWIEKKTVYMKKELAKVSSELEWGVNLRSFRPRMQATGQVSKVIARGWNPLTKQAIISEESKSISAPKADIAKQELSNIKNINAATYNDVTTISDTIMLETHAKARLNALHEDYITAEGEAIGDPNIRVGRSIEVKTVGRFNGTYAITAARHVLDTNGYQTTFTIEGGKPNYSPDMLDQNASTNQAQTRQSIAIGIVTNIKDPDGLYRVKVKFPTLNNEHESDWIPVTGIGASNISGLMWLPQINDVVVVAFDGGNLNTPYILTQVWNGKDKPPEANADKQKDNIVLKTPKGHIIRLVEGPSGGDEKIQIIDSKEGTTITLDASKKTLTITTKSDISIKSNSNINLEAANAIKIKGASLELTGTSSSKLNSSGVTEIKGAMVNIN